MTVPTKMTRGTIGFAALAVVVCLCSCRACDERGATVVEAQPGKRDGRSGGPATRTAAGSLLGGERGIDHVGVAVKDLQAARRTYEQVLGFNRPVPGKLPNGIQNVNFYFEDATYLETLNAWAPEKVSWLVDFIERFENGGIFLVLSIASIPDTSAFLRQRGVAVGKPVPGRVMVEGRKGGSWRTLFFKSSPLPGNPAFFIEYPRASREKFLRKLEHPRIRQQFFRHRNTAIGIKAVWCAVRELERAAGAYRRIGLQPVQSVDLPQVEARGQLVEAGAGKILLVEPASDKSPVRAFNDGRGPGVFGISVEVKSLTAARQLIGKNTGRRLRSYAGPLGAAILLPPELTHGIWLELFESS